MYLPKNEFSGFIDIKHLQHHFDNLLFSNSKKFEVFMYKKGVFAFE